MQRFSRMKWDGLKPIRISKTFSILVRRFNGDIAWLYDHEKAPCGKWYKENRIDTAALAAASVRQQWWMVMNDQCYAHYKPGPQLEAWRIVCVVREMLGLPEPDPATLVQLSAENERVSTYNGKPESWGVLTPQQATNTYQPGEDYV